MTHFIDASYLSGSPEIEHTLYLTVETDECVTRITHLNSKLLDRKDAAVLERLIGLDKLADEAQLALSAEEDREAHEHGITVDELIARRAP